MKREDISLQTKRTFARISEKNYGKEAVFKNHGQRDHPGL